MKFVIDRADWARGGKNGISVLLNRRGAMCCLGFVGQQCGVPRASMLHEPAPSGFPLAVRNLWPSWLFKNNSTLGDKVEYEAMMINDATEFDEQEREAKLIELFAKNGDELEFVG